MADRIELMELTADLVSAHVGNNAVATRDLPNLINTVHGALVELGAGGEETQQAKTPVVSIHASINRDCLICLECGRKQKALRKHLQSAHGMTAEQYRKDYGLPFGYPMTAPEYSERRREIARSNGFGRGGLSGDQDEIPSRGDRAENQNKTDQPSDVAV